MFTKNNFFDEFLKEAYKICFQNRLLKGHNFYSSLFFLPNQFRILFNDMYSHEFMLLFTDGSPCSQQSLYNEWSGSRYYAISWNSKRVYVLNEDLTYLSYTKRKKLVGASPVINLKKRIVSFPPERFRDGPTLNGFLRKKRSKVATSFIFPAERKSDWNLCWSTTAYLYLQLAQNLQTLYRTYHERNYTVQSEQPKKARLGKPQLVF